MLEGLEDEDLEWYLDENPRIVPLFEINVVGTSETYTSPVANEEPSEESIAELRRT